MDVAGGGGEEGADASLIAPWLYLSTLGPWPQQLGGAGINKWPQNIHELHMHIRGQGDRQGPSLPSFAPISLQKPFRKFLPPGPGEVWLLPPGMQPTHGDPEGAPPPPGLADRGTFVPAFPLSPP